MASSEVWLVCAMALAFSSVSVAFPKHGKQKLILDLNLANNYTVTKWMAMTLRRGATIDFSGSCDAPKKDLEVLLNYHLVVTPCARLLDQGNPSDMRAVDFQPEFDVHGTKVVTLSLRCTEKELFTEKAADEAWETDPTYQRHCVEPSKVANSTGVIASKPKGEKSKKKKKKKKKGNKGKEKRTKGRRSLPLDSLLDGFFHSRVERDVFSPYKNTSDMEYVCSTQTKNVYALVFWARTPKAAGVNITLSIDADMRNTWGYLAALDYPFLTFYAVMTAVYSVFAFAWLLAMMCQYKDLLRVQFWIGAVLGLGMVEKVFFFSQYNQINNNGDEGVTLLMAAEFVSVAKRTLARLLVMVIALGFGIVKPRLGPNLVWVTAIGIVYFLAALVEGVSRATATTEENGYSTKSNVTTLVVLLLDVGIIYYIYTAITDTMRTLRLRRNTAKLSLYRHFSNAIIFAVLASAAFGTWSYIEFGPSTCIKDWQEMWLVDGFWHILFCFLLLVMMVLWRPSANNNRYAYSPLVDLTAAEEEPEQMPGEAFDGLKLRNLGQEKKTTASTSVDDDLKWVEENIPTSLVDAAVPVLMDSEDELSISRFEVSKMQ